MECLDESKVLVLLDCNASTNTKVQKARAALARQLRSQGADIQILNLPTSEGVNGPDDYIGLYGDEAMATVLVIAPKNPRVLQCQTSHDAHKQQRFWSWPKG